MIHESPLPLWHQPSFWVKCTEHLAGTKEYICRMHYCFHVWNWIHGLGLHFGRNSLLILKRKAFFTCSKHDPCISHSSLASCSCSFIYLYLICYGLWLIKHLCFYFFVLEISCSYIVSWAVLHWQYNFHFYTCLIPIFLWNLKCRLVYNVQKIVTLMHTLPFENLSYCIDLLGWDESGSNSCIFIWIVVIWWAMLGWCKC